MRRFGGSFQMHGRVIPADANAEVDQRADEHSKSHSANGVEGHVGSDENPVKGRCYGQPV